MHKIFNKKLYKKNKKKHVIAFICTSLDQVAGGLERQLVRVASKLDQKGYEVKIITQKTFSKEIFDIEHPENINKSDIDEKNDVLIILSNSGESHELTDLINFAKKKKIKIVSITSSKRSLLSKNSDINLILPAHLEADKLNSIPTTSTTRDDYSE